MKRLVIMCRLYLPVFLLPVAAVQAVQDAPPAAAGPAAGPEAKAAVDDNPELTQTVNRYQNDIRRLQMQDGAYAPGLSETLLGLGEAYSQMGAHEEAARSFKQALYFSRINSGLYSLIQLPYVDRLIEEYTRLGDMQKAGDMYSYKYWVYKRNYGDNDLRTLAPIEHMQTWLQQEVYKQDGAIDLPLESLHQLNRLNYKAITVAQTNYGKLDPRLIDYLFRYSESNLIEAEQADSRLQGLGYKFNIDSCFGIGPQSSGSETYFEETARKLMIELCTNYHQGKLALHHVLTIYRANNMSVDSYVRTVTRIGDWEMLFQQSLAALRYYNHAYDILEKAGQGQTLMNELFGQPRLLTTANSLMDGQAAVQSDTGSDDRSFALVSLDVSRNGRARNIKVVHSVPADDEGLRIAAERYVRAAYFRPRMEDGKSVETQGIIVTYHEGE
jgi:tetratricopeptide (TPR) repeat protein